MLTTKERVQEVVKPIVNVNIDEKPSIRTWFLDELDMYELISDLETEFGIEIKDEDVDSFKMVNDIVCYIDERAEACLKN